MKRLGHTHRWSRETNITVFNPTKTESFVSRGKVCLRCKDFKFISPTRGTARPEGPFGKRKGRKV